MLQPMVGWLEFHEVAQAALLFGPALSKCPVMAAPSAEPLVQLPQVMSARDWPAATPPGKAVPSGREPVRMSW